jgi:O-6-methylguanine DNA methyltransferase
MKKTGVNTDSTLYFTVFETRAGWMGVSGTYLGLERTTFPRNSRAEAELALFLNSGHVLESRDYFKSAVEEFLAYFNGYKVDFNARLDLSAATPFEREVWETTRQIVYGETRSYRWVACEIDKPLAPRAVGQALGRNPLPVIIPCHRVLTSNGKLGGFGGGLAMKQYLLDLESQK